MSSNPITVDIKDLLIADSGSPFSFGGELDWCINISAEPERPDNCLTIFSTGGREPGLYNDPDHPITEYPSFQVRLRGNNYLEVREKMNEVLDYIQHIGGFTVTNLVGGTTTRYADILPVGHPQDLPMDESRRYITVMNFYAIREEVSS